MSRKILSVALSILMITGILSSGVYLSSEDSVIPFTDVTESKWFYDSVVYVYQNDLMNGMNETTFAPQSNLSRAMFVTIIGRLYGAEGVETSDFTDVKANSWYSGYVGWAVKNGIVNGFGNGIFKPNDPLTREQMAAVVDRFIDSFGIRTTTFGGMYHFNDEEKVSSWALDSLAALRNSGVVKGDNNLNFNPKQNITRAEAATIVMRLREVINNAWHGYLPTEDTKICRILGASYLYWNGSAFAGTMKHHLEDGQEYPELITYMDDFTGWWSMRKTTANTVGATTYYNDIDTYEFPFVKIAYRFDGMPERDLEGYYRVRSENAGTMNVTATKDEDDAGYSTAIISLEEFNETYPNISWNDEEVSSAELLLYPCDTDYDGEGTFNIFYIGFFRNLEEAKQFRASQDSDIDYYLKNYTVNSEVDWNEYTDADREYYDNVLYDAVSSIKNSESAVTPKDITSAGHKAYYVSYNNGDDSNDGLSPKTALKTPKGLWTIYAGGQVWLPKVAAGDGVFFERGNVWHTEQQYNYNSFSGIISVEGVTYGAYGTGDKPLIKNSVDFRESGGTGVWQKTEYENIWVIDMPDEKVYEVGCIYFDGGKYEGIRICGRTEDNQTLAAGNKSVDRKYVSSGYNTVYLGRRDLTNAGTALQNDFEYFYDKVTNKVYLYLDWGDPADCFESIDIPRSGACAFIEKGCTVDNIAFLYSSDYAVRASGFDVHFTNCEVGYVAGSTSSVESGIEVYGPSDDYSITNTYIHDIGDGAITIQNGTSGTWENPENIENAQFNDNVFVACGLPIEIWCHISLTDEEGHANNRIRNIEIRNNIMAYTGYGLKQIENDSEATGIKEVMGRGSVLAGDIFGEVNDCIFADNIYLYGYGSVYYGFMANYQLEEGWTAMNNTYIFDPSYMTIGSGYHNLRRMTHTNKDNHARWFFEYSYAGLTWYTSNGIDPMGKYYWFSKKNNVEELGYYFMTGYYAEHGGFTGTPE